MNRKELEEVLDDFKESNSNKKLLQVLKERLVKELEDMPSETDRHKHDLNLLIRDLEEELDWVENEKLAEFDPEQQ